MTQLTHGSNSDEKIFNGRNGFVVRLITKHVRNAIHRKCNVQSCAEAAYETCPERNPQTLVPEVVGRQYREMNVQGSEQWYVIPGIEFVMTEPIPTVSLLFLPHDDAISFKITHINLLSLLHNIGMRRQEEPSDVRKEKSSLCIVRI
jgi:hypothetical protein